jgi:copper(I)-binding protein
VFVTLTSPTGDKLLTASSPAAAKASVHETQMEGTVMRMRPVEGGLPLPAGKAVKLSPGGYHIMLEGLKAPLKPGADVPVTLTFAQSPPLEITAHVMPVGSPGPGGMAAMPGMKMKMPGMEMK